MIMARGKRCHDASLMRPNTKQHRSAAAAVVLLPAVLLVTLVMSGITSAAAGPAGPSAADGLESLPLGPTGALPPPLVTNPDRAEKGTYHSVCQYLGCRGPTCLPANAVCLLALTVCLPA